LKLFCGIFTEGSISGGRPYAEGLSPAVATVELIVSFLSATGYRSLLQNNVYCFFCVFVGMRIR
jgi:hypothetical protein